MRDVVSRLDGWSARHGRPPEPDSDVDLALEVLAGFADYAQWDAFFDAHVESLEALGRALQAETGLPVDLH